VHAKVLDLIEHYEPAPLAAEVEQKLKLIIASADERHEVEEQVTLLPTGG
jgi:hypothetical protein